MISQDLVRRRGSDGLKVGALAAAICSAVALSSFAVPSVALAQTYAPNYPVCLQVYAPIQYIECRYTSIPQCQATATGLGAMCLENPYFVAGSPPGSRKRARSDY